MTWHQHPLAKWLAAGGALYGIHYLSSGGNHRTAARAALGDALRTSTPGDPMLRVARDRALQALLERQASEIQLRSARRRFPWERPLSREEAMELASRRRSADAPQAQIPADPGITDAEFEILEEDD